MSPLEKVPFATFYPLQKYLRGTCFFSKTTFSSGLIYWCSRVILCIQFYRLTQLFFSTSLKGIIRKECQSFTYHGHAKTPPTVFNPLSLWLTLPRDMGVRHTQWPHSITRAILACLWFVQGLYRVCTGYQKIKTAEQFTLLPASFATPICIWRSRTNRSKSFILDLGHWRPCRKFCQFHEFGNDEFLGIRQIIVILWKGICFSNGSG